MIAATAALSALRSRWKLVAGIGVVIALGVLIWFVRHDAYNDGQHAERAAWEARAAKLQAQADRLQRLADQSRHQAETLQRAAIARNRQEIDNAISKIPDQAPSARQLSRACIELRRQGQKPPACEPQSAARPAVPR